LYLRLRNRNPATFAGYFDLGDTQIVSASPERFLHLRNGQVEARPIKGTRSRTARPEADLYAGDEMLQNEKDRAENVMIVDLLRNDLSRVCTAESVRVTELCRLEIYWSTGPARSNSCARPSQAARLPAHRRCGRWKSLPNWNPRRAGPIAGRWVISASMARWMRAF
jgi:hypothetical protein